LKPIVHIGFPKTGTTSLQKGYFEKHPEFNYIGQTNIPNDIRKVIELDILSKSEFEYNREHVISKFQSLISTQNIINPGKVFIFSHEALTYFSEEFRTDMAEIARRISDIFSEAKILITIRRQDRMLCSLYQQAVKGGAYISFNGYLEYYMENYHISILPLLKYVSIIKFYKKRFGTENVFVQCFEEMKEAPERYFKALSQFCNVRNIQIQYAHENKGFGGCGVLLQRVANRIVKYDLGRTRLDKSFGGAGEKQKISARLLYKTYTQVLIKSIEDILPSNRKIEIPKNWKNRILDLYGKSNQQLCNEFGLPLKLYNYPGV